MTANLRNFSRVFPDVPAVTTREERASIIEYNYERRVIGCIARIDWQPTWSKLARDARIEEVWALTQRGLRRKVDRLVRSAAGSA